MSSAEWKRYADTFPDRESVSGPGSTLEFTAALRAWLPELIVRYGVHSILDAPCGDVHWIRHVDLSGIDYLGWDLHPGKADGLPTERVNLLTTKRAVPMVDLILCRDFFAHLTDAQALKVLAMFRASGSRYLLATTFPGDNTFASDVDADGFAYRPVNLCAEPFNLPEPIEAIDEPGPEVGRRMALWALP